MFKISLLVGISVFSFGGAATTAIAQEPVADAGVAAGDSASDPADDSSQLGEIIVTAQKRSESMQKIPVAVTAFSGEALTNRGATSLGDLGVITPGLKVDPGNGIVVPFLRGVGSTLTALGNESSVAVFVDGVYYTRVLPGLFSLNNVERVEVLKGPQGTLFGRNATGGVIQIITPLPSSELQARGHVGYGNYNTLLGDLYVSGGLGEGVAADLAISGTRQKDGFGKNIVTGMRTWFQDDLTVRSKLAFTPTDDTKIILSGFYTYVKNTTNMSTYPGTTAGFSSGPFVAQPTVGFFDQNADVNNFIRGEQYGGSLTFEQNLGFATLKSITAYMKGNELGSFDFEKSPRPDGDAQLATAISQFTQEFQLASLASSSLTWLLGAFYYDATSKYDPANLFGPSQFPGDVLHDSLENGTVIRGKQKAKSYSFFGQATYEILPRFKLTGGIRYTYDDISAHGTVGLMRSNVETIVLTRDPETTVSKMTFKAALGYQFTPDVLGYASFSRGFKSGGFNLLPVPTDAYRPETIDAYETGLKTELFDRHVRLNLTAFWYEVGSPQVQLLQAASVLTANAGSARVKGAEVDGAIAVSRGLTINFAANYLDAKYRRFDNAPAGVPILVPPFGASNPLISINAAGNHTPLASKFTASFGAIYKFYSDIGEWVLSGDYAYNDGYYFEPSNLFKQKAFSLVNARIELRPTKYFSVGVWAKNLLDKRYVTFQNTQAGPSGFPYTPGAPRRYGATLGFEF